MALDSPQAEVDLSVELVRDLLRDQHPHLAREPISFLAEGWDNAQYRLGPTLVVRLPRRHKAVQLIENERRWLPQLAPSLPLPVPAAVFEGTPSDRFRWPWLVVPFIDGHDALEAPPASSPQLAVQMAEFFLALHVPAPAEAPENPFRGVALGPRADNVRSVIAQSALPAEPLERVLNDALTARPYEAKPVWVHGDPHPGNIVVSRGRILSIIDWGDITSGEPSSDLGSLWMMLSAQDRELAFDLLKMDEHAIRRARGWALNFGMMLIGRSADRPTYLQRGHRVVDSVLSDEI